MRLQKKESATHCKNFVVRNRKAVIRKGYYTSIIQCGCHGVRNNDPDVETVTNLAANIVSYENTVRSAEKRYGNQNSKEISDGPLGVDPAKKKIKRRSNNNG